MFLIPEGTDKTENHYPELQCNYDQITIKLANRENLKTIQSFLPKTSFTAPCSVIPHRVAGLAGLL
jgi:hypothetical protein